MFKSQLSGNWIEVTNNFPQNDTQNKMIISNTGTVTWGTYSPSPTPSGSCTNCGTVTK